LPVYPLQSYYYFGTDRGESSGLPFVAGFHSETIQGIALARVDRVSVAMAHVRAVFGAALVFGSLIVVGLVGSFTGMPANQFAKQVMRVQVVLLIVGAVGGAVTYLVPNVSARERRIREHCGELLGVCIAPARISREFADALESHVARLALPASPDDPRCRAVRELVEARLRIVRESDDNAMERRTDGLLEQLRIMPG
jgi:hypothetical protein